MREIKFRAWNKEKKIMVYKNEDGSSCFWDGVIASSVELINTELNSEINQSEYEFMQYTGLKDKNGVEIYEGDILEYMAIADDKQTDKVIFDRGTFVVDYSEDYKQPVNEINHCAKVIGNIYDNPELIEKEGK